MADITKFHRSVASSLAALLLLASPAAAQDVLPDPEGEIEELPSGPMHEETGEEPEDLSAAPDASKDRLESLFEALADPGNEQWEQAEAEIWRTWSRSGSASMDLLLRRADKAADSGDLDLALVFLDDLVRLSPDFAEGWNKRATLHFMREDYGRSVADIERTLALEPRHFGALSGLAIILERTGDKTGALRAWRRAVEIHPHLGNADEQIEKLVPDVEGREL